MTAQNDLDRMLGAWFGADAAPAPPPEPLLRVLERTRRRRARPSLLASIGDHWIDGWRSEGTSDGPTRLRPGLVIVLAALLAVALAGAALLVGSWLRAPAMPPPATPPPATPQIPHAYLNELVQSSSLPAPKAFPRLVSLVDGRVLAIGTGGDGGDQTTTAVLYDAATGQWKATGEVVEGSRLGIAAAALLPDGRVLLIGAASPLGASTSMVTQVFDPGSVTFSAAAPAIVPRAGGTLTSLRDGRVLLVGGTALDDPNTAIADAELFDPAADSFTSTGALRIARSGHTAELLGDGTVLVYGGVPTYTDGLQLPLPAERFDPSTGTFTMVHGPASVPGSSLAVHLPGGELLFVEQRTSTLGRPADGARWDAASGRLVSMPSPTVPVWSAVGLDDGLVLVAGATALPNWLGTWDTRSTAIRQVGTTVGFKPSLVRLADGRVLVVGGLQDAGIHSGSMAPAVDTVQIFQ